ncbi:MAG: hypothetical protein JEZ08_04685 [Clostridiales bacterium]|nr:hypothetical protein [Clostridiales bacterium]
MKSRKMILIVLLLLMSITECFANSAEPPSIIIIASDAPEDLTVSFIVEDEIFVAEKHHKLNEYYYTTYDLEISNFKSYIVRVESNEGVFTLDLNGQLNRYSNIFTLDYSTKTISEGKSIKRSIVLITLRVFLTLLIEGIIFILFKYRDKYSWFVFLTINLITQGALNIWINTASPFENYIIIYLVYAELFILMFEMIGFAVFIKEKKKITTIIYVLIANVTSLVLGGIIIPLLPI